MRTPTTLRWLTDCGVLLLGMLRSLMSFSVRALSAVTYFTHVVAATDGNDESYTVSVIADVPPRRSTSMDFCCVLRPSQHHRILVFIVKSSQVVGLRDRVAIIRALLHAILKRATAI